VIRVELSTKEGTQKQINVCVWVPFSLRGPEMGQDVGQCICVLMLYMS